MPFPRLKFLLTWRGLWGMTCLAQPILAQPASSGREAGQNVWGETHPLETWAHHFRLGATVGLNIKADFRTGGQLAFSGKDPGPTGVSGADHFFDDGYVRVDQTGNAQQWTSYWGYENSSQYNPFDHTLLMHRTTSVYASDSTSASQDDAPYVGLELAYGANLWNWRRARLGWEVGFGTLPIKIADEPNRLINANVTQSIYSFDTAGIVMPTAPYHGGNSGIGPTIRDIAAFVGLTNVSGMLSSSQIMDADLYAFRVGPSVNLELNRRLGAFAGVGPAVGRVSGDVQFKETIVAGSSSAANSGKIGATKVVYGVYVNAAIMYHAAENADLYLGAQFMSMGDATLGGGGRQARLRLGGQTYISAGISWLF